MPIRFTIDHAKRLVHACAEGAVTRDDVETFMDAVMVADAMPYRKLFDGRTAYGKYNDDDLMMLGARVSAYASVERRGAVALVPAPEYVEMTGRFINLGKSGRAARIFTDVDEAMRWLMVQPDVL